MAAALRLPPWSILEVTVLMKKRFLTSLLFISALCCLLLCGCGGNGELSGGSISSPSPSPSQSPAPSQDDVSASEAPGPAAPQVLCVNAPEDIQDELCLAMAQLCQPRAMDISGLALEQPELDVTNLYYEILADRPELKYAYSIQVTVEGSLLNCSLSYMPYKTGEYPADFQGAEVRDLGQLISLADDNLGSGSVPLRITDPSLEPDEMNKALHQSGGGYFSCTLNQDATAIVFAPPLGMDAGDCLQALEEADKLADSLISQLISPDMGQEEKARALYSWLCSNVEYDQRYYSDRASMPYESQTALGALRDGTAICGGYSHALKLLFEKAGIPCFNVTGIYYGENHMWNIAQIDGRWLWFDATSDRGSDGQFGYLRFALEYLDEDKYQWDYSIVQALTGSGGSGE